MQTLKEGFAQRHSQLFRLRNNIVNRLALNMVMHKPSVLNHLQVLRRFCNKQ